MSDLKHIITRSVGFEREVQADLLAVNVSPGDAFLLCSDGLCNYIDLDEFAHLARQHFFSDLPRVCLDIALERGGEDNVTCVVIGASKRARSQARAPASAQDRRRYVTATRFLIAVARWSASGMLGSGPMRDTEVLRRRLWAQIGLIGLPLATVALLAACDGSREVTPVKQADRPDTKKGKAEKGEKGKGDKGEKAEPELPDEGAAEGEPAQPNYAPPARIDDIPDGEFDYYGPPRDPFNEHEEEEGCPNGDWCGSPDDARKFAIPHMAEQLGCPAKIIAQPTVTNSLNKNEKRWEGLSFHPMMQGRLMSSVTKEKRDAGQADICCYHWFEYCSGRPLLDGEEMIVASLREGSSWSCDPADVAAPDHRPDSDVPEHVRERLGQLWVDDALAEHAAIAAFERATLELMAMAAPPTLLGEVQLAAADEVEHATHCFGLAARFSGLQREPGPLHSLEPRVRGLAGMDPQDARVGADWVRLALDTFVEGCVGETIATLIAKRAQRHCQDPARSRCWSTSSTTKAATRGWPGARSSGSSRAAATTATPCSLLSISRPRRWPKKPRMLARSCLLQIQTRSGSPRTVAVIAARSCSRVAMRGPI